MGRKSREKRERRRARQPDEVFQIAPGVIAARKGRTILVENRRTPEEHKAFLTSLREKRPEVVASVDQTIARLRSILAQGSPLKLLAIQAHRYFSGDPETAKEYESEGPALFVEYPTWLVLTNPVAPLDLSANEAPRYQEFSDLVQQVIAENQFLLGMDPLEDGHDEPTPLDAVIFKTRTEHLYVRQPTYTERQAEMLKELFGPFGDDIEGLLGFRIEDALRVDQGLRGEVDERLNALYSDMRQRSQRWVSALKGKSVELDAGDEAVLAAIREQGGKIEHAFGIATAFVTDELHTIFTVTPEEISRRSGVPEERVRRCLELFSLRLGQAPIGDSRPNVYEPMMLAPLLNLGDGRWFVHLLPNLIWALQPRMELEFKKEVKLWHRYDRHRSKLLEAMSIAAIKATSPHVKAWQSLKYEFDDGKGLQTFELDGLLAVDGTLFLAEAKAGTLTPSARRGAERRLMDNLKALVGEAHEQALRARRYIESAAEVEFRTSEGASLRIKRADFTRVLMVTTTLDQLSAFVTRVSGLAPLGIIPGGVMPWSVYWDDLRIICELTEGVGQLVHYLDRRERIERQQLDAHDELDWFGHYLSEGLYFKGADKRITLRTYTTGFDDYFAFKAGTRLTPAEKPRQEMPPVFRELIQLLESRGPPGFIDAVNVLLDADGDTRVLIAKEIAKRRERAALRGFSAFRMTLEDRVLAYCAMRPLARVALRDYVRAAKYREKVGLAVGIGESVENPGRVEVVVERFPWVPDKDEEQRADRVFASLSNTKMK